MDEKDVQTMLNKHEREIAENRHGLANARQILDIQLAQLTKDIGELKNALKWAGGLIISLMISFMGWAALQQYNANEEQKRNLQEQVNILASQEKADEDRQRIIDQLARGEVTATDRDNASIIRDGNSDDLPARR